MYDLKFHALFEGNLSPAALKKRYSRRKSTLQAGQAGPTMCPKIRTYRRCAYTLWRHQRIVTNCRMRNQTLERESMKQQQLLLVPQCVLRFVHIIDARTFWRHQRVVTNCRCFIDSRSSVWFLMRQLVTTCWWRQNVRASMLCTNLRTHCGTNSNCCCFIDSRSSVWFRMRQLVTMRWWRQNAYAHRRYVRILGHIVGPIATVAVSLIHVPAFDSSCDN